MTSLFSSSDRNRGITRQGDEYLFVLERAKNVCWNEEFDVIT